VGDGFSTRHLLGCTRHVDVNPLVIPRGFGELVDGRLIDGHPVGDSDFFADELFHVLGSIDDAHVVQIPG